MATLLGKNYRFFKSRLELRAPSDDGENVLVLSAASKFSPYISLAFYFGRHYAVARPIEKLLEYTRWPYHIQQYSLNRTHMSGLTYSGPYSWSIDITNPMESLVSEIESAVHGMAEPFFKRFATISAARDAIAADDPWCFAGPIFWRQLLILDGAMDDLNHFRKWAVCLDDFNRTQALADLEKLAQRGIS